MATAPFTESTYGLAFETSSAIGSVALGCGDEIIETRELSGPRRHAVEFLPTVDAICKAHAIEPASVRRVYVSSGPGSFTGLRIGITAARMIAFANGASLVGVPTLDVIAQNALFAGQDENLTDPAQPPGCVVVVLDAKRGRVYAAAFVHKVNRYVPTCEPVEADPAQFLADHASRGGPCAVMGEGVLYHRAAVEASGLPILPELLYPPRAGTVYRLGLARARQGEFSKPRTLIPTYVRLPEAEEKWQQRHK
ncbi:MAG: tRNA (adenosine(37)-N6)-threonylcarbamoyltransferase complex dimerization subunit type 1 TsaB [Phycisphaerae bacterium]